MAKLVDVGSIASYFESLDDPRHTRNRRHLLVDIAVIAVDQREERRGDDEEDYEQPAAFRVGNAQDRLEQDVAQRPCRRRGRSCHAAGL